MKFWKYQGTGNDFILVDCILDDYEVDTEWCKKICDRHYGVGGDGVLYVLLDDNADLAMRIINADGTEAEMCGNGIRCVAKHAYDYMLVDKDVFTINTKSGIKTVEVAEKCLDLVRSVRVDMGAPELDGRKVPVDHDGQFINEEIELGGTTLKGNAISMGNPHFITFTQLDESEVERLGPIIESHPFFPNKTNVEFCSITDGKIYVKVYERGAAWTLACGTGACATTVAAALNGLVPYDEPVTVVLPGGPLKITVSKDLSNVRMEGPATMVFIGDDQPEELEDEDNGYL